MAFFYKQSTNVSFKHLIAHTQPKSIVKNESVAINSLLHVVAFGFGAKTRNVAQQSSSFSILNTHEQVFGSLLQSITSLVVGIHHHCLKSDKITF